MSGTGRQSNQADRALQVPEDDLVLDMAGVDFDLLLADWRWLVDETYEPVLLTALGDLFLQGPRGSIYWLQPAAGRFSRVAGSLAEFQHLLRQPAKIEEWLDPELVSNLQADCADLEPEQCYGYLIPPLVGGRQVPTNLEPTDLYVHFGILGQLASQMQDAVAGPQPADAEGE